MNATDLMRRSQLAETRPTVRNVCWGARCWLTNFTHPHLSHPLPTPRMRHREHLRVVRHCRVRPRNRPSAPVQLQHAQPAHGANLRDSQQETSEEQLAERRDEVLLRENGGR